MRGALTAVSVTVTKSQEGGWLLLPRGPGNEEGTAEESLAHTHTCCIPVPRLQLLLQGMGFTEKGAQEQPPGTPGPCLASQGWFENVGARVPGGGREQRMGGSVYRLGAVTAEELQMAEALVPGPLLLPLSIDRKMGRWSLSGCFLLIWGISVQ